MRVPRSVVAALATICAGAVLAVPSADAAGVTGQVQLTFPLVARYHALARWATAVTTPGSRLYGDYEPVAELARRFGATAATRRRVVRYLRRNGATGIRVDATSLYVDAQLPRAAAASLFSLGPRATAARRRGASAGAVVPAGLRGAAAGVVGLRDRPLAFTAATAAPGPSGYATATGTPSGCAAGRRAGGFTPAQYLGAYGYSDVQRQQLRGAGEQVALIEIDGFRRHDIVTFARCFHSSVPRIVAHGVGVHRRLAPGGESTLDLEVLDAAAPRLKRIDVYESPSDALSVLEALTAPLQHPRLVPQVISVSLGMCEPALRASVGRAGMRASNATLEIAAASGISIVAASGDSGSSDCLREVGGRLRPVPILAANYPASSPWVTAVGGTNFTLSAANAITDQVVWNDTGVVPGDASGGGFSGLFKRPSYQRGVVARDRRALPDVAMLADVAPGYDIFCTAFSCDASRWQAVGGTSAAAPLVAGGFALVDQRLRQAHRRALGLANPLLYRLGRSTLLRGAVFGDVTVGDNDVIPFTDPAAVPLPCCVARPGYDLASGWGSIDLAAFEAQALRYQPRLRRSPAHGRPRRHR